MEDPRRLGSACREPDVTVAVGDEAGTAGREGSLAWEGRRKVLCRKRFPVGSTVCGDNQLKRPFDRVAQGHAIVLVPEGHGIKKSRGVGAFELQGPRLAAVDCFVDAGSVASAGAEQIGSRLSKRLDIAEVELSCAGHGSDR